METDSQEVATGAPAVTEPVSVAPVSTMPLAPPQRVARNGFRVTGTIAIGMLAVVVSAIQLGITWLTNERTITAQANAAARELAFQEAVTAREWNLKFAEFFAAHQREIFSSDSATRERMRSVILITYPDSLWASIFNRLARAATQPAARRTWRDIPPIPDSSHLGSILVRVSPGQNLTTGLDVYFGSSSYCDRHPASDIRRLGPASNRSFLVRARPGQFMVWLQRRGEGIRISESCVTLFDIDVLPQVEVSVPPPRP